MRSRKASFAVRLAMCGALAAPGALLAVPTNAGALHYAYENVGVPIKQVTLAGFQSNWTALTIPSTNCTNHNWNDCASAVSNPTPYDSYYYTSANYKTNGGGCYLHLIPFMNDGDLRDNSECGVLWNDKISSSVGSN